ncbi:bifunctional DNA primase/polymerase [Arthrobacter sp. PAMC25284]|uniref:bifunctional DNA primase/polymerase n=1 Tax=Arthrobacter sp. PAMC25284 TaxID=2861279 RepID=UPI001C639DDB|nr:bifunctional DNA primase/polymerase [Arthrobacter sp. PAMC25284]QYF88547.1 bifunctional DNA primase/polymerase [Arthrobacter sp. PAMC25284]
MPSWRTTDLTPASKIKLRPGEGFGIDCEHNGIVVIDPDTPEALKAFADLWENHEGTRRLSSYAVTTPRGHHFYFYAIDGVVIRNSASKLAPNLDVRGVGGFVNAPPTPGYKVLLKVPPLELPEWLADMLVATEPRRARTDGVTGTQAHSIGGLTMTLANAQQGTRNDVLHWSLCRAAEMPAAKQRSALRAIRNEARMIGLGDFEIEKTIASVFGGQRG